MLKKYILGLIPITAVYIGVKFQMSKSLFLNTLYYGCIVIVPYILYIIN